MPRSRPKGSVFISYAKKDVDRVEPLVKALARQLNVWWDRDIPPGATWRWTIQRELEKARCVVVLWTVNSVQREFVWSEVERAKARGVLLPVKLDANTKIPLGFDQRQTVDLTTWNGRTATGLKELVQEIKRKLALPRPEEPPETPLATDLQTDSWVVAGVVPASNELAMLADRVQSLGGILIPGAGPVEDLLGTLGEVHRTYAAVGAAIKRFLAPVVGKGPISVKPFVEMERGFLMTLIADRRGHCTRILEHYGRVGGLREWLRSRMTPKKLAELDEVFTMLGAADGDLFDRLARIGDLLTNEAGVIAGLLLTKQEPAARQRILEGRMQLLPLEQKLNEAMVRLQSHQASLGYVAPGKGLGGA
jgi:hypothetical protein